MPLFHALAEVLRDTADDIAAGVRAQAPRLATALRDASDAADVVSRHRRSPFHAFFGWHFG
jgi:hypothetical protein